MKEPIWILHKTVLAVHQMLLASHGGNAGIRDFKLLDSALARPRQRFGYELESTIFDLASSYSFGIVKNHPFIDGKKRVGLTVGAIFLEINGFTLNAAEPETAVVFENVAKGSFVEKELALWYKNNSLKT